MKKKRDDKDSTARLESFIWHTPIDCRVGKICHCSRSPLASAWEVLKKYRENSENGEQNLNPPYPFPSGGFDRLEVLSSETLDEEKWPDAQGRHWWKLKLSDESTREDFYWTWADNKPEGVPGGAHPGPYSFIVHCTDGTKIEGFSWNKDNEKGRDRDGNYWWYTKYTECDAIKDGMEQKDKNYQIEREQKKEEKDSDGKKLSSFSSRIAFWQQPLPQQSQSKQFGYYLHVTSESRNKEMVYHFYMQDLREPLDDSKKEELKQITEDIYGKEHFDCRRDSNNNIIEITLNREGAQILLNKLQEILSFADNLLPGEALSPRPCF